jgi:hypothetical protein
VSDIFKQVKKLLKLKKDLDKIEKLDKKKYEGEEKARKTFEKNANKAAKTILKSNEKKEDPNG